MSTRNGSEPPLTRTPRSRSSTYTHHHAEAHTVPPNTTTPKNVNHPNLSAGGSTSPWPNTKCLTCWNCPGAAPAPTCARATTSASHPMATRPRRYATQPHEGGEGHHQDRLEPDGIRAETVTLIAKWRLHEQLGYDTIAERLNQHPPPTATRHRHHPAGCAHATPGRSPASRSCALRRGRGETPTCCSVPKAVAQGLQLP